MATSVYVELLRQVPFLEAVPPDDLAGLVQRSAVRHVGAGERVVMQGEFGHSMFVLVSGALVIHASGDDQHPLCLGRLDQPGQFFGEMALLGRGVRLATVHAEAPAELLEIERNPFDLVVRRHHGALVELERYYHSRSIATYTRLHRYLGQLDEATLGALTEGATMRKLNRNEVVCKAGDPATSILLVKDGVLKMVRTGKDDKLSILAYFNTHDVIGAHDPVTRTYELVTLGQAEIIFIDRRAFARLEATHPDIYARFGKDDMHRSNVLASAGHTVINAAQEFLAEGVEVESLLVINLDRCVRCGNCVRACHARHQFTRLDRRGPIFRRRVSMAASRHEHILIPSSCRHCRDPECMIGCPTGAIQRLPDGDVVINDNCVGCDNCARKCPYGNITMRPLPPEEHQGGVVKRAIKCDLCRGYQYSNCVYECPRGAVLRVDPLRYFDELSLILESEQREALEWRRKQARDVGAFDSKQRSRPRSTWFIKLALVALALALAALAGAYFMAPAPHTGRSAWGLGFGVVGAACVGAAMLLGARKRLRNHSLGPLEIWTQFHMVIGTIGFAAALCHAGFRVTGVFTATLLVVFALQIVTGVLGQAIYMVVPRMLTRLERGGLAKLFEDLVGEELDLDRGIAELTAKAPPAVSAWARGPLRRARGSVWLRLRRDYDAGAQRQRARDQAPPDSLPAAYASTAERLIKDNVRLQDVHAQIMLHRLLRHWLIAHLATSGALAVFLLVHVVAMLLLVL